MTGSPSSARMASFRQRDGWRRGEEGEYIVVEITELAADLIRTPRLPLDSILIMLTELRPLVLDLPAANSAPLSTSTTSTSAAPPSALSLLSSASLSGLLPPAPTPHPRKFLTSPQSMTWLASLIYGNIYLSSLELLRDVDVKLFGIAQGGGRKGLTGLIQGGGNPLEFVSGAASALFGRVGR